MKKCVRKNLLLVAAMVGLGVISQPSYAQDVLPAPTLGNNSSYTWTNVDNGLIPVTIGGTTYYIDIKQKHTQTGL